MPGDRDHLISVTVVHHRERRPGAPRSILMRSDGRPRQASGADPTRMPGDDIAGDTELSVCVLERMVRVLDQRNQICRSLAGRCHGVSLVVFPAVTA